MESFVHYALLGSLLAGAAGALVLAWAALKQGLRRRDGSDQRGADDGTGRIVRLGDTIAVLCFAVSAGFGVIGLVHQTQPDDSAAVVDNGEIVERLREVERRLTSAELQLRVRAAAVQPSGGWEEQVAELEERLAAVEARAAAAYSTPPAPRSVTTERPPTSSASKWTVRAERPSASTPPRPAASESAVTPAPAGATAASAPSVTSATPHVVAPSPPVTTASHEGTAPPSAAPREEAPIGEQMRREWETVKRHARSGAEELRHGWEELKRLLGQ